MKKITILSILALMHTISFADSKDIPITVNIPTTLDAQIDGKADFKLNTSNATDSKNVTVTVMSNKKHDVSISTSCQLEGAADKTKTIPFSLTVDKMEYKPAKAATAIATDAAATDVAGTPYVFSITVTNETYPADTYNGKIEITLTEK